MTYINKTQLYLDLIQEILDNNKDVFSIEYIEYLIDSLANIITESQARNFEAYPILGSYVWPNYFIGDTWESEIQFMKEWISARIAWMDGQIDLINTSEDDIHPVNAYEISVDTECENILALNSPVAADLRFVISVLKISSNLERIGDHAYRLAKIVLDHCLTFKKENIKELQIESLFEECDAMLSNAINAFEKKF